MVFLDYSGCFDTLSCSIHLDTLVRYGMRGVSLDFIKDYFANRSQYVCYDAVKSSIRCQEIGFIQRSKTSPLFYDIYSSYFSRMCSNDKSILYANETVLVYVGTSLEELADHVNSRLGNTLDWYDSKKLSLNPLKSEFMGGSMYVLFVVRGGSVPPVLSTFGNRSFLNGARVVEGSNAAISSRGKRGVDGC